MGAIIAKFRKKKSTYDVLEELESKIKEIEEYKTNTELQRKRIVGQLILFSVGLYVLAAVLFYFYFFPATLYDQLFYITPLLVFPIIIIFVRRLLIWYYNRRIRRNESKLGNMKKEKKKILEEVMDKETYKIAKGILEKFAPDQLRGSKPSMEMTPSKSSITTVGLTTPNAALRHRAPTNTPSALSTSIGKQLNGTQSQSAALPKTPASLAPAPPGSAVLMSAPRPTVGGLPMPRSILPRERSVIDKMVEYLVGDGPGNRFALICKSCQSHNGMALREEFEYVAFRCCYCYHFNPARKLRPSAPKLEQTPKLRQLSDKSTSESEKYSGSDSESSSDIEVLKDEGKIQSSDTESTPMEIDKPTGTAVRISEADKKAE